jgi:hypothetical protein
MNPATSETSRYYLRSSVYWCWTDEGLAFLDAQSQRYLALSPNDASFLGNFIDDFPGCPSPQLIGAGDDSQTSLPSLLEHRGLLTRDVSLGKPMEPVSIFTREAVSYSEVCSAREHVRLHHVVRLIEAAAYARWRLKHVRFDRLIHAVTVRKRAAVSRSTPTVPNDVRTLASIYWYLRCLVTTSSEKCLLDSLILIDFLARYRIYPEWIVGIRTQPFLAHSWVQAGALVLNDSVEKVRRFFPMLVV